MVNLYLFDVVVSFSQLPKTSTIFLKYIQTSLLWKSQKINLPEEIFRTPSFRLSRHVFYAVFWYFHIFWLNTRSRKAAENLIEKVNWSLVFQKVSGWISFIRISLSIPNSKWKVGVQIKSSWSGFRFLKVQRYLDVRFWCGPIHDLPVLLLPVTSYLLILLYINFFFPSSLPLHCSSKIKVFLLSL